jgi:beta-galactosidase
MFALLSAFAVMQSAPQTFSVQGDQFILNGKPFQIHSGEMHYPRVPEAEWRVRMKMARAMGLNTICTYVFWNAHERRPGEWDFSGNLNVAKFVRTAQEEGLYVLLRPGPYVCTEWDLGGLPSWLLKDRSFQIRSKAPEFMKATQAYFKRLGEEVVPLLIENGGPIIMTQVENEYGSYGKDKVYLGGVRDALRQAGFKGTLFTSDGPGVGYLEGGTLPDVTPVINFGGGAPKAFQELEKFRKGTPKMIGEFWAGWFDHWGKRHHTSTIAANVADLDWCLKNGVSFSIYMFHGGTNFGWMQGANGGRNDFNVDTTSYDYDSALDESGRVTPKFMAFRELLQKYSKAPLPPIPAMPDPIEVPTFSLKAEGTALSGKTARKVKDLPTFEDLDQAHGIVRYRATSPVGGKLTLTTGGVFDYARVLVNGKLAGIMDRRRNQKSVEITVGKGDRLEIDVETLSRINFGEMIPHERKGLKGPVLLGETELKSWEVEGYPLDVAPSGGKGSGPIVYRGSFTLASTGDTFFDMRAWNKGFVWLNGRNLGRFWKIGPQQTLFVPRSWLKKGKNEVVVMDDEGTASPTIQGLTKPILDQIETPPTPARRNNKVADLSGLKPALDVKLSVTGTKVALPEGTKGRYLVIEAMSEARGGPWTTLAEVDLYDASGAALKKTNWKVAYADSEETDGEDGKATNAIDNQPTTFWHTEWSSGEPKHPHVLILDLGSAQAASSIQLLPRSDGVNGKIDRVRIYMVDQAPKGI